MNIYNGDIVTIDDLALLTYASPRWQRRVAAVARGGIPVIPSATPAPQECFCHGERARSEPFGLEQLAR